MHICNVDVGINQNIMHSVLPKLLLWKNWGILKCTHNETKWDKQMLIKITLGLFVHSLKTSENLWFSDVFRGIERGHFQPSFSHFSLFSWKLYIFGRIALFKKYHEALIPNCYEDVLQAFNIFKNICCLMKRLTLKFWLSTEFKRNNRSLFLS